MIENWEKLIGKYSLSQGTATVLTFNVKNAFKSDQPLIHPDTFLQVEHWVAIVKLECNFPSKLKVDTMYIRVKHPELSTSLEVIIDEPECPNGNIAHFWINHKDSNNLKTPKDFITWIFNDYANKTHHFVEW